MGLSRGSESSVRADLCDKGSQVLAKDHAANVATLLKRENADRKLIVAAERDGGRVYHPHSLDEEALITDAVIHRRIGMRDGILIVNAFDFGGLAERLSLDLHCPERGCGIGREIRIARSSDEDDDAPLFEMADSATADIGLGDLADVERRDNAGGDAVLFERVAQGETVDDRREHAHVIRARPIHAGCAPLEPAEDIAASDDDAHLHSEGVNLGELCADLA